MRRVMLLALLALGLPTALLAKSTDFDSGKFEHGTISGTFTTSIDTVTVGSLGTITLDTGTLIKLPTSDCTTGFTCYRFSGGSLKVAHGGTTIFTDKLEGGLVERASNSADILATLQPQSGLTQGTAVATLVFKGPSINAGSADVSFRSPVPEPSTLGLVGTGLIGLAGMVRRKLKLGA